MPERISSVLFPKDSSAFVIQLCWTNFSGGGLYNAQGNGRGSGLTTISPGFENSVARVIFLHRLIAILSHSLQKIFLCITTCNRLMLNLNLNLYQV